MLFYQTAFENKSLKLAVGNNVFKAVNIINHSAHLFGVVVLRAEVLAYTVAQRLSLADIYNFSVCRVHNIHPRQKWEGHSFFSQL